MPYIKELILERCSKQELDYPTYINHSSKTFDLSFSFQIRPLLFMVIKNVIEISNTHPGYMNAISSFINHSPDKIVFLQNQWDHIPEKLCT